MKKNFKLLLMLVVFTVLVLPSTIFAKTITLKKDTVMTKELTGDNVTITGKYKLTLKKGAKVKGNLVINGGATVISESPGINAKSITISGATVNAKRTTYGGAIGAEEKVTITNSKITATATSYGDFGILGKKSVTITNSDITASTSGSISIAGISSDGLVTIKDTKLNINTVGTGISGFNDDVVLSGSYGTIKAGSDGISTNKIIQLKDCILDIDGASIEADVGEDPNGISAFDSVIIDGGKYTITSTKGDGIFANNLIEVTNKTFLVNATGKEYGLHVWVNKYAGTHGEIKFGDDILIEPNGSSFDETKGAYVNEINSTKNMTLSNPTIDEPVIKVANTLKVKVSTKTVKYSVVKKKNVVVSAIKIEKKNGGVSYSKVSGKANFTVNKTNGKITVKKKTKKGTYKIKVKVTASGDSSHKVGSKTVTVTIKVK